MTQQLAGEGGSPEASAALVGLVRRLADEPDLEDITGAIVAAAAGMEGAAGVALYESAGGSWFRRAGGQGLATPEGLALDADSALGRAARDGTAVTWRGGRPPSPLEGVESLATGIAHGLARRGTTKALLLVGGPALGPGVPTEVSALAAVASAALGTAELTADRRRLALFVEGALEISASLLDAETPSAVENRLLRGLVDRLGMAGAALWVPSTARDGVDLVRSVGLPEEVRDEVRHLTGESATAAMAVLLPGQEEEAAVAIASTAWADHHVRLVEVPDPARGVLGVYFAEPLPDLVDGILATLAHGLAIASHLTALHARTRSVVDALQSELRPAGVTLPDGIELGCVYQSATVGVDVGGDFYDVFSTDRGEVGIVCGDVSGKGIEAASLTAMAVHSLRAYALYGAKPQTVVQLLNGMVCERTAAERFMTLTYARLNPETWVVELAVAGHPPPLVIGPGGVRVHPVPADLPVGIDHGATYEPTSLTLLPGEALVLYTDGVTEARRATTDGSRQGAEQLLGVEGLVELLGPLARHPAQEVADGVWSGVQDYAGGGTSDDCAVVVLRRAEA